MQILLALIKSLESQQFDLSFSPLSHTFESLIFSPSSPIIHTPFSFSIDTEMMELVFLAICFFGSVSLSTSVDQQYEACSRPASCGDGQNITYPFRIPSQPQYCGQPGFDLACREGRPVLRTARDDYLVHKIFQENQSLWVMNMNWTGRICQPTFNIFTFSFTSSFQISQNQPFLLVNCYNTGEGRYRSRQVECGTNTTIFVYDEEGLSSVSDQSELCRSNSTVPVMTGSISADYAPPAPWQLFEAGFFLSWISANCTECRESGGYCGFNYESSESVCFCEDRPQRVNCKSRRARNTIIGVFAGGLGGMAALLAVVTICYKRRKRLVKASSVLLARNTSPYGSSSYDLEKSIGKSMNYPTHVFSYLELDEATNSFDSSNELGDGGFGTVYYGKLKDGRSVAVKKLYENNLRRVEQFLNEVQILSLLRHQNLVSLYGCTSRHSRELLLVYEYIPNGTVADHLHGKMSPRGGLTWPIRLSIAVETAEALAYLHAVDPPIIHRDVKTNNILLDNNFRVKVADFGLSRLFPLDVTHISTTPQGTPGYLDPDYHKCYQLTDKSDVYSFGVVLAELISSKPAVDITRHRHDINLANMIINKIRNAALDEFVDSSLGYCSDHKVKKEMTYMAEVAFRCLGEEKDDRPSMDEVTAELKRIQRGELHCTGTRRPADGGDNPKEDVCLLKSIPPPSPDTVMGPWHSTLTTPNTSS